MKIYAADDYRMIVFGQRTVELNRNSAFCFAEIYELRQITRIMIEHLYSLGDKRRNNFPFFFFRNFAVNSGRKNYANIERHRPVRDQAAYEQIDDLTACRPACRVRHDQ